MLDPIETSVAGRAAAHSAGDGSASAGFSSAGAGDASDLAFFSACDAN
jgi:hypothetical protein